MDAVKDSLSHAISEAIACLEFRDLVHFDPHLEEWQSSVIRQDEINTVFGKATCTSTRNSDGVIVCTHPSGDAYLNGSLVSIDDNEELYVQTHVASINESLNSTYNNEESQEIKNLRCKKIDLRGCYVDELCLPKIARGLEGNYLVESLTLSGNKIDDIGAMILSKGLMKNGSLTELNLSYNNIGPRGSKSLSEVLVANRSLLLLDLSHNKLGPEGTGTWFNIGLKKNKTLKTMILSFNQIGDTSTTEIVSSLMEKKEELDLRIARKLKMRQRLEMQRQESKISNLEQEKQNVEPALVNSTLRSLQLSNTGMSDTTCSNLLSVLQFNLVLQHLDISSNSLSITSAQMVADAIEVNKSLLSFDFSNNQVTDPETSIKLIQSLGRHSNLQVVKLQNCFRGSESATAFANLLENNSKIRRLDLCECKFSYPGIVEFAKAISSNTVMTSLELCDAGFYADSTIKALVHSLEMNQSLTLLNLAYNNITIRGCKWLQNNPQNGFKRTILLDGNNGIKSKKGVEINGGLLYTKNEE